MRDRLTLIDSALRTLGIDTAPVSKARRLLRSPLPALLDTPDAGEELQRLAVDVDAGRVADRDALAGRLVLLVDAGRPDSPLSRLRAAVVAERDREAGRLLAGEADRLRRAVDGVIAGARREDREAARACDAAGVTGPSTAYGSSATLAAWERRQAAAARLSDVLRAERILTEQGAITEPAPAPPTVAGSARERVARLVRAG
jgi:hypothetical protein